MMKLTKRKKLFVLFVSVVAIVSAVAGSLVFSGAASSVTTNLVMSATSTRKIGIVSEYNAHYNHDILHAARLNGSTAYCMNYGKYANGGQKMTSSANPVTRLSATQKELLGYCLANGCQNVTETNHYTATQAMVWNIVNGKFNTSVGDSAAQKICNAAQNPTTAKDLYFRLKEKILKGISIQNVSFANPVKDKAKTYTMQWNKKNSRYEVTLTDNNKSLDNYSLSVNDIKSERNGNKVTFYSKKEISGSRTVFLQSKTGYEEISSLNLTYWNSGVSNHQEFVSGTASTKPVKSYLKLNMNVVGSIELTKTDQNTGKLLQNAKYGVYSDKKCSKSVATLTTDSKGKAKVDALLAGTYYIKEIKAPKGYNLNDKVYTAVINTKDTTAEIAAKDTFITPSPSPKTSHTPAPTTPVPTPTVTPKVPNFTNISVEKSGECLISWENGKFVYKRTSLAGAEYQIIAQEPVIDTAGETIYAKGEVVDTVTTDKNGKATSSQLYYGTYSIQEIKAPEGFILDETLKTVTVNSKEGTTVAFTDERQKVDLTIKKLDKNDNKPVMGAKFNLYANETIKNRAGQVIMEKDTLIEQATSNENGNVHFTSDLPLGEYKAKEVAVPEGYIFTDEEVVFNATYQGADKKTVQITKTVLNQSTEIEVTKKDITSGQELSGAKLTIKDKNGNVVDSWESVAGSPHKIRKLVVGETYTLIEDLAPAGYLVTNEVKFVVKGTKEVQKVEIKDEVPTGNLEVIKKGEALQSVKPVQEPNFHHEFTYNVVTLAGITFDVTAAEDIKSVDGQNHIFYKKGEKIGTLTTGDKGTASLTGLPLGKYNVKETSTLDGYVLDKKDYTVELKYKDQNTKIVTQSLEVLNKKQRVAIRIAKQDAGTNNVLSGASFTLKTKNDIKDGQGNVLIKAGELVERQISDNDGNVVFSDQLPNGVYLLEEETAPKGYVRQAGVYEIDASYNKDAGEVIQLQNTVKNRPIKVDISKKDITGENELEGAKLTVFDKEGNVIDTWVSEKTPHRIEKLPVGTYTLREETAPYGYVLANDIPFEVTETAEIQQCVMNDDVVRGQIVVYKTNEEGTILLKGAEFEIRDAQGNVMETLVTDDEGKAVSSQLPAYIFENGVYKSDIVYTLVETKAPEGYIADATEYPFSFAYQNDRTPIIQLSQTITNVEETVEVTPEIPNVPTDIDTPEEVTPPDTPSFFPGPKTGDTTSIIIWIVLLGVCAVGIVFFVLTSIKSKKKENTETDNEKKYF